MLLHLFLAEHKAKSDTLMDDSQDIREDMVFKSVGGDARKKPAATGLEVKKPELTNEINADANRLTSDLQYVPSVSVASARREKKGKQLLMVW